jgi:hypothetical protein
VTEQQNINALEPSHTHIITIAATSMLSVDDPEHPGSASQTWPRMFQISSKMSTNT